jgi:hypothetical protein
VEAKELSVNDEPLGSGDAEAEEPSDETRDVALLKALFDTRRAEEAELWSTTN